MDQARHLMCDSMSDSLNFSMPAQTTGPACEWITMPSTQDGWDLHSITSCTLPPRSTLCVLSGTQPTGELQWSVTAPLCFSVESTWLKESSSKGTRTGFASFYITVAVSPWRFRMGSILLRPARSHKMMSLVCVALTIMVMASRIVTIVAQDHIKHSICSSPTS